jgi:O-antigen ligase
MPLLAPPHLSPAPAFPGKVASAEKRPAGVRTGAAQEFPCRGLSVSRIALYSLAIVAFLLINKGGLAGNLVFFTVIAGMMISSPSHALAGFTCAVLGLSANTAFVAKTIAFTFSRVLSLGLLTARFTLAGNLAFLGTAPYLAMTIFCATAALCSIASGYYTAIALIKVLVFWTGMTGFFGMVATIRQRKIDTTEWFVSLTVAVVLLSVLSLALGVAQNFRETVVSHGLYNLAFYHSNTAGPICALLVVYLLNVVLFAGHRNRWICLPVAVLLAYLLWMTHSRTALISLVAGTGIMLALAMVWGRGRRVAIRLNYSRGVLVVALLVVTILTVFADVGSGGKISRGARSYIAKKAAEVGELSAEDIMSSRTGMINRGWANFQESPVVGIGFGVSTDPYFIANASLLYAPVEKGFLPVAVLEEVGILGTVTFVGFLLAMFATLVRDGNIPGFAMFFSFLMTNLGEASFFALGGHASFMWLFVLGGIMLGDRCATRVQWGGLRR